MWEQSVSEMAGVEVLVGLVHVAGEDLLPGFLDAKVSNHWRD